jgi:hypothetical protein
MSVLPFKEDDDFRKHNQFAGEAAGEELRTFLGDFEAFDAQIADARSDQSDLITVMKSKGWNVKALRRLGGGAQAGRGRSARGARSGGNVPRPVTLGVVGSR